MPSFSKINYFDGPHIKFFVMEPMRISSAEVIEIFGDSDSENGHDFAGYSSDDIDVHGHNECRNNSASIAYE